MPCCGCDFSLLLLPLLTSLGVLLPCSANAVPIIRTAITMFGILGAIKCLAERWRRRFLGIVAVFLAVSTAVSAPDELVDLSNEIYKFRLGGNHLHGENTAALKSVGLDTLADATSDGPGSREGLLLGYIIVMLARYVMMWWGTHKAWREARHMGLRLPMGVCSCSAVLLVLCVVATCHCCAWPAMLLQIVDVRAGGMASLSSGGIFAIFDAWGKQDGIITPQDMDAMVTSLGAGTYAPWGHFLFDSTYGDWSRYRLDDSTSGTELYNNAALRDLILSADSDGDGAVQPHEFLSKFWRADWPQSRRYKLPSQEL